MARTIAQRELRNDNAKIIEAVLAGESFVVTSRGRPVAKVTPVDDVARQGPEIDALLDFVSALPRRSGQGWRREDLYE